jgi:aminoglycoside phosphotransferase (APT) family kinase protein
MNGHLSKEVEGIIGKVNSVEIMAEQGCTSEVSRVEANGKTYVLKSAFKEKYRNWLAVEAHVLERLIDEKFIPVPRYYGFFEQEDGSHLLMSYEQGITLTAALRSAESFSKKERLIRSFGQFLQQLHELEPLEVFQQDENWLDSQLSRAQTYVENGQTDGTFKLLEHLRAIKPRCVRQTMIHGDCTTDNVLVVEGEVRMFIDVAGMTIGDPRYDEALAIGRFIQSTEYLKAFYEGYTRYKVTKNEYEYFDEGLYTFF